MGQRRYRGAGAARRRGGRPRTRPRPLSPRQAPSGRVPRQQHASAPLRLARPSCTPAWMACPLLSSGLASQPHSPGQHCASRALPPLQPEPAQGAPPTAHLPCWTACVCLASSCRSAFLHGPEGSRVTRPLGAALRPASVTHSFPVTSVTRGLHAPGRGLARTAGSPAPDVQGHCPRRLHGASCPQLCLGASPLSHDSHVAPR